jgi:hypothetical protein
MEMKRDESHFNMAHDRRFARGFVVLLCQSACLDWVYVLTLDMLHFKVHLMYFA